MTKEALSLPGVFEARLRHWEKRTWASEVFRGQRTDVYASPVLLRDAEGQLQTVLVNRAVSFFESEFWLLGEGLVQQRLHVEAISRTGEVLVPWVASPTWRNTDGNLRP